MAGPLHYFKNGQNQLTIHILTALTWWVILHTQYEKFKDNFIKSLAHHARATLRKLYSDKEQNVGTRRAFIQSSKTTSALLVVGQLYYKLVHTSTTSLCIRSIVGKL